MPFHIPNLVIRTLPAHTMSLPWPTFLHEPPDPIMKSPTIILINHFQANRARQDASALEPLWIVMLGVKQSIAVQVIRLKTLKILTCGSEVLIAVYAKILEYSEMDFCG